MYVCPIFLNFLQQILFSLKAKYCSICCVLFAHVDRVFIQFLPAFSRGCNNRNFYFRTLFTFNYSRHLSFPLILLPDRNNYFLIRGIEAAFPNILPRNVSYSYRLRFHSSSIARKVRIHRRRRNFAVNFYINAEMNKLCPECNLCYVILCRMLLVIHKSDKKI